jgi:two-component system CheB/CheR fusion protein
VVGVGASAGGLEAFEQFFMNLPPDSGMAFILVQHLAPDHTSLLPVHRTPIDTFFRSLAEDQGDNAVCILLSGTGTDGTL